MLTVSLIFYVCVVLVSLLIFFMNFTSTNAYAELFIKILGKLIPLFTMSYSCLMIYKTLGLL